MRTSLKELVSWKPMRTTRVLGDRRDYFDTSTDDRELFHIVVSRRKERAFAPTTRMLQTLVMPPEFAQESPQALFDACAQTGVRRVIQVSALGTEGSATEYARTKLAGEEHLLALNRLRQLNGIVLRPSLVFGRDGGSARLGDHVPAMPWCSETLALLGQDNVAPPDLFRAVLGHAAIAPTAFLHESW